MNEAQKQTFENVMIWAKTAVEETRAKVGWNDDDPETLTPSWLPELEGAIEAFEAA